MFKLDTKIERKQNFKSRGLVLICYLLFERDKIHLDYTKTQMTNDRIV